MSQRALPKPTHRYASRTGDVFQVVLLGRCEEGQLRALVLNKGLEYLTCMVDRARLAPLKGGLNA